MATMVPTRPVPAYWASALFATPLRPIYSRPMARISCPECIGRAAESAALDRAAPGTTLLVGGEAGIGKSRLTAEFCRRAAARDALVLTGGCVPFGRSPLPFTPVVEALRTYTR